jgi:hypothetical protein
MNSFEYLLALISIIAGLGLTRALSGLAGEIHTVAERGVPGVRTAWTASALLWLIAFWWFSFTLRAVTTWTVPLLMFVLGYASVIYFMIALLHPDERENECDSLTSFIARRRWFFSTFVGLGVLDLADTWLKYTVLGEGLPPMISYSLLMGAWIFLGAVGVVSENKLFHRAFAYLWVLVMFAWVTSALGSIE